MTSLDATAQATLVRSGQVSPEELEGFPAALADGPPEAFGTAMVVVARHGLDLWEERLGRPLTEADAPPAAGERLTRQHPDQRPFAHLPAD